jgi:hypothetical protein
MGATGLPTENRCGAPQKTLRSPLAAVWGGGSPVAEGGRKRILSHRWALQAYCSQFRRTPRGRQPAVIDESARQPGVKPWPIGAHPLRPDDSCRLNDSGESPVRVFLRATKVAEGHARESGGQSSAHGNHRRRKGPWGCLRQSPSSTGAVRDLSEQRA